MASSTAQLPTRAPAPSVELLADLGRYVEPLVEETKAVPAERRAQLDKLAGWINERRRAEQPVRLTFICTHNSRRSHMGQLWAQVAASYYGLKDVETYSGGTEATAFNPRAVAALKRAGFGIDEPAGDDENPRYEVRFATDAGTSTAFSKKYDDEANPSEGFAAVMTCSQADATCPIVKGAAYRVAIPYEDPKEADGTPEESQRYDERAKQIATEMLYLFSRVEA